MQQYKSRRRSMNLDKIRRSSSSSEATVCSSEGVTFPLCSISWLDMVHENHIYWCAAHGVHHGPAPEWSRCRRVHPHLMFLLLDEHGAWRPSLLLRGSRGPPWTSRVRMSLPPQFKPILCWLSLEHKNWVSDCMVYRVHGGPCVNEMAKAAYKPPLCTH